LSEMVAQILVLLLITPPVLTLKSPEVNICNTTLHIPAPYTVPAEFVHALPMIPSEIDNLSAQYSRSGFVF
jgi:hypothetical protein